MRGLGGREAGGQKDGLLACTGRKAALAILKGRPVFLMKGRQTTWLLLALAGTGSIPDPLISQIPALKRTQVCRMFFFLTQ